MKLKVKVTKEHINSGHGNDPRYCPIARAMNEINGVGFSDVGKKECYIVKDSVKWPDWDDPKFNEYIVTKPIWKGTLPKEAQNFVNKFDEDSSSVKPFEFEIELKRETMEFCNPDYADNWR